VGGRRDLWYLASHSANDEQDARGVLMASRHTNWTKETQAGTRDLLYASFFFFARTKCWMLAAR